MAISKNYGTAVNMVDSSSQFTRWRRTTTRRSNFTLIELLVVIAILSILAAMLLPALQQARTTARASNCLSKIKQILVGVRNYADDSNNYKPCAIWNQDSASNYGYHYKQLGGGSSLPGGRWLPNNLSDVKFWRCSTFTVGTSVTYGLNAHHGDTRHFKYDVINRMASYASDASKWSRIKSISSCWLYSCGLQFGVYRNYSDPTTAERIPDMWNESPWKPSRLYAVHGKVIPMGYLDGHAEKVRTDFYDKSSSAGNGSPGMEFWGTTNWANPIVP